jgi:type I restriction enzyme S subunit
MTQGWNIKKLGEIASFSQGIQVGLEHHLTKPKEGYVRFIRIVDYTQNTDDIRYVPNPGEKYFVNGDDIVMVRYGTPGLIGRGKIGVIANNLFRIKIERNDITNDYLSLFLSQDNIQNYLRTQGSATMPALNFTQLKTIEIKFPPLSEQERIVSLLHKSLTAIDKVKANAEQNLNNAKELYENSLFNIFKNKNNWISSELGEKATFRNGMNFTKNSKGEKIKIVGVKDFQNNYWVPFEELDSINLDSDLKEIDALNKDDIIAVRSNGNPELIGRTLLAGDFEEKVSHSGFTIRIRLNTDELLPNYVCHFLKSQKARKSLIESGNGVSIKSLNQGSLSSLTINYPKSRTEQKQIVSKIESLKEETAKLEKIYCRKLDDLDELKKSILHKAFNGEL